MKELKEFRTELADSSLKKYEKSQSLYEGVADKHQEKICVDTVKNPAKGMFMGGPSAAEAEKILRTKFKYTDEQIAKLKK